MRALRPESKRCVPEELKKCQLSRDQTIQYLVEILKTPMGEVTADQQPPEPVDQAIESADDPL